MANQSKLKAWVRYDGTGRVISGGPIFQVNKPKVGNWKQIDANLCCNGALTTTTTTTSGGGGGTPTAWVSVIATTGFTTAWDACNGIGDLIVVYTSVTSLTAGTYLYSDAALTTLIPYSGSIAINGLVYDLINGQLNPLSVGTPCEFITTTTSTTTQALTFYNADYQFGGVGNPCNDTGQFNIPLVVVGGPNPCGGAIVTLATGTWASYGINPGATILVNFGAQGTPGTVLVLLVYGTNSSTNNGCTSCG